MKTKSIITHPYHLVDISPWPLTTALRVLIIVSGLVKWFHYFNVNLFLLGLLATLLSSAQWWRDVSREATFQGLHTEKVIKGLQIGIILFITSEIIFFFSFFWAFFHSSLSPTSELGRIWPPTGIYPLDPIAVPLLNTIILLASGVSVTFTHFRILNRNFPHAKERLLITVLLGFYFTRIQAIEYIESPFSIADSVYGAIFFVATGFHGLHVLIGALFLRVTFYRLFTHQFSSYHHFGFEAAAWYWHFVDVVWLFLFTFIYWWGR